MPDRGRRPLVSANWKMNLNHFEAIQVVQKLAYRLTPADERSVEISVHPPFTDLRSVQTLIDSDGLPIALGAQNCHWEPSGAFTGEVSPTMLEKLNVRYVIVGHSERRHAFGESDDVVARKLRAVLAGRMSPILCVGDTLEEHDAGVAGARVEEQVRAAMGTVSSAEDAPAIVIAYEPIWAIGTGRNATPDDAQEMCSRIRTVARDLAGSELAGALRIQYGGSVKPSNAAEIMAGRDVDGLLVGGASLDPDGFALIVHASHGES